MRLKANPLRVERFNSHASSSQMFLILTPETVIFFTPATSIHILPWITAMGVCVLQSFPAVSSFSILGS